jgi:hypothetical protein
MKKTILFFLYSSTTALDLRNLQNPLVIVTPASSRTDVLELNCMFWNVTKSAWDSQGMVGVGLTKSGDRDYVLCETTHLTDFSTVVRAASPTMNIVDPIKDSTLLLNYNPENLLTPLVLSGIVLVYLILLVIFTCIDVRKKKLLLKLKEEIFVTKGRFSDPPMDTSPSPQQDTFFFRYLVALRNKHEWYI